MSLVAHALDKIDLVERVEDIDITLESVECILLSMLEPDTVYFEDDNWPWIGYTPQKILVYFTDLLIMARDDREEMGEEEFDITIYELTEILRLKFTELKLAITQLVRPN